MQVRVLPEEPRNQAGNRSHRGTQGLALEPTGCGKREQVPVDGQVGTLGLNGFAGQGRLRGKVFDLVVVSGNRGYDFTIDGKVGRDILLAMLGTVKLDPVGQEAQVSWSKRGAAWRDHPPGRDVSFT